MTYLILGIYHIDISFNKQRRPAPLSAAQAATIILDGVRSGSWRILVGEDAKMIDAAVRATPEAAYDYAELFSGLAEETAAETPER